MSTKRNVAVIAGCIVLTLLMIWGVTWYRQQRCFLRGEEHWSGQDYLIALHDYEATIRFYTPFSKNVETSVARLLWIANHYRECDMTDESLMAYRALKTSLYAIRSFYEPFKTARDLAERNEKTLITRKREEASALVREQNARVDDSVSRMPVP